MTNAAIEAVLKATAGTSIGALIPLHIPPDVRRAMMDEGLIGIRGGLTRKGSIRAERLQNAELDRLFG